MSWHCSNSILKLVSLLPSSPHFYEGLVSYIPIDLSLLTLERLNRYLDSAMIFTKAQIYIPTFRCQFLFGSLGNKNNLSKVHSDYVKRFPLSAEQAHDCRVLVLVLNTNSFLCYIRQLKCVLFTNEFKTLFSVRMCHW